VNRQGIALGLGLVVALGLVAFQVLRPPPSLGPTILLPATPRLGAASPDLPWPAIGSGAVAVGGLGVVASHGPQTALPLASTTKIMTGLLVLEGHPLGLAQPGPMVPIGAADAATYAAEKSQGQSVFPVAAGEQLSEYQALQALLVPSGNNIADLLATWDAGSVAAFVDTMNAKAKSLHMTQTHFADASGYSPDSVGSPGDLIRLAEAAMRNPVFAEIVGQAEATLPIAGRVFNVDALIGQDGIIGVKTGSSPPAGACFVFAADLKPDGQPARLFGAVMGLPTLDDAFTATSRLVNAVGPALHYRSILSTYQVVAEYSAPWGDKATVFSEQDLSWVVYDGMTLHQRTDLKTVNAPLPSGSSVGSVTLQVGEQQTRIPLRTTGSVFDPDLFWRATRLGSTGLF
jgi:D-alanyl-D-alanine carboxypeptidase (penicillin-binding protein 5/6)